jgi:excisionase family DNA binding protein
MQIINSYAGQPGTDLFSISKAGEILNRSRSAVYRHLNKGELLATRIGGSVRIRLSELRKLLGVTA